MMPLPDGGKSLKMFEFVEIQPHNVMDDGN